MKHKNFLRFLEKKLYESPALKQWLDFPFEARLNDINSMEEIISYSSTPDKTCLALVNKIKHETLRSVS